MVEWLQPDFCWPPHKITHLEKFDSLVMAFHRDGGWGDGFEALVGYPTYDQQTNQFKIQLLTGSHRWAAAEAVGVRMPVVVVDEETVELSWGDLPRWKTIMNMGRTHAERFL